MRRKPMGGEMVGVFQDWEWQNRISTHVYGRGPPERLDSSKTPQTRHGSQVLRIRGEEGIHSPLFLCSFSPIPRGARPAPPPAPGAHVRVTAELPGPAAAGEGAFRMEPFAEWGQRGAGPCDAAVVRGQAPLLGAACALHTGRRRRGAWPRSMETNGIAPTHPHGPRARRHAQPHASAHHGPNAAAARALDEVSGFSAEARPAIAPDGDRHRDGGSARGGLGGSVRGARGAWRAAITEPSAAPLLAALPGGRGAALRFAGCERPATGGGGGWGVRVCMCVGEFCVATVNGFIRYGRWRGGEQGRDRSAGLCLSVGSRGGNRSRAGGGG